MIITIRTAVGDAESEPRSLTSVAAAVAHLRAWLEEVAARSSSRRSP